MQLIKESFEVCHALDLVSLLYDFQMNTSITSNNI